MTTSAQLIEYKLNSTAASYLGHCVAMHEAGSGHTKPKYPGSDTTPAVIQIPTIRFRITVGVTRFSNYEDKHRILAVKNTKRLLFTGILRGLGHRLPVL